MIIYFYQVTAAVAARAKSPKQFPQTSIKPHLLTPRTSNPLAALTKATAGSGSTAAPVLKTRKVFLCPTCKIRFPCPEPDPEISFKANFSCHVLFKHLKEQVMAEMGSDDMEVS